MENYSFSSSLRLWRRFGFFSCGNLSKETIAKIILIKPIKFYDLISIIFKRGFLLFAHPPPCRVELNFNAFVLAHSTAEKKTKTSKEKH